jgi:predicted Rossmann fold flavoprotein
MTLDSVDAIVLGAGAAGLMCAAVAGQRDRRVVIIDHADQPGKKILISGGGRCNFTNIDTAPDRYLSENPHFAKSALSRYTAQDFLALVERARIAWHEKTLGQLFCDGSARQIVALLLDECAKGAVDVRCNAAISDVRHDGALFHVVAGGRTIAAPKLVLATGGPSIPKMGATGFAYDVARQFGLKIVQPRPALVPFTLAGDDLLFRELSGISAEVVARTGKAAFREAALFTHRGLSGPAILQISSYWRHGDPVTLDLLPGHATGWMVAAKRATPRTTVRRLMQDALSERLVTALCARLGDPGEIGGMTDKALSEIERTLANWQFHPSGTEGYAKAEVTAGGISTAGLSSRTMEAQRVPGLFAIGEAVDVTGWLGGYNFQWAWSSGWAAGRAI